MKVTEPLPAPGDAATHAGYRRDIDGLRAVAVLAVVAYHLFPGRVRGGFVGVDIFFVISGFLISGIIFRGLETGRFRFADFYSRRVRRIFPALVLVLVCCLAFGWIALLADEYAHLGKHVAGGAGFISNWLSWAETGYFDSAAELKPLLHLWSLGIEEQFYLVWPVLLFLAWRRHASVALLILVLLIAPFSLNVWTVHGNAETAFYLPFTRFWELMIGGALAWISHPPASRRPGIWQRVRNLVGARITPATQEMMAVSGLALIGAALAVVRSDRAFPGWWATIPSLGAFLTIAAGERTVTNRVVLCNPVAVWFGAISYPLYLWHWPLLAFARILSPEMPSWRAKVILGLASVALAWLTYRFVEKPIRSAKHTRALPLALVGALAAVGLFGLMIFRGGGLPARFPAFSSQLAQLQWPFWKNDACEARFAFRHEHGWWFCMLNAEKPPTVALLGNSHANQLYPGLVGRKELSGQTILNIGACDPVDGLIFKITDNETANPCREQHLTEGNDFIRGIVRATPSLRFAILGSYWPSFTDEGALEPALDGAHVEIESTQGESSLSPSERYFTGLSRYVSFLEADDLRVILVLDTPRLPYDARECLDIRPFPKRLKKDCLVTKNVELARQASFRRLAARLIEAHPTMKIFDPIPTFCQGTTCSMARDGKVLLRDQHHLSETGSRVFAETFVAWARQNVPALLSSPAPAH